MFQDEEAIFLKDGCGHYQIGNLSKSGVVERRIRKDEIKGLVGFFQIPECISPDYGDLVHFKCPACILDKFEMSHRYLNGHYRLDSPGSKLIANTPGSGEEVQHLHIFQIILVC